MNKKSIKDVDIAGKRVLMRVDFNVPLDKQQNITDDNRIRAALPTIRYIIGQNAKLILISHLGRPKGAIKPEFSLKPVVLHLSALLGRPIRMLKDCVGPEVEQAVSSMGDSDVLLLEDR